MNNVTKNNHNDFLRLLDLIIYFRDKARDRKIFKQFCLSIKPSFCSAYVVANTWYAFSKFMPKLLCLAGSKVACNLARCRIIQTAYEELGMGNCREIHSDLFGVSASNIGIDIKDTAVINSGIKKLLDDLYEDVNTSSCDMEIFGVLCGLEIVAHENIEALYISMLFDDMNASILQNDIFFSLHRTIETEHVIRSVEYFTEFEVSKMDFRDFEAGFLLGVKFWKVFWNQTADYIDIMENESKWFQKMA